MIRLPDFEAWAIFAKIAENGSFARTAEDLGVSQGTISKAITRLEKRTRTTLFHRNTRRVTLTETGRSALDSATRMVAEGEGMERDAATQSTTPRGRIRIAAPMSFGIAHLAPLLPKFMSRFPDVSLDVDFDDDTIDLVDAGFDIALRIGSLGDSNLLARRLCGVRVLLVGSPRYFERRGRPLHPRDLSAHATLFYTYSRSPITWRFHHRRHVDYAIALDTPLRVNNAEALNPALLAGLGVALQPEFLVWRELRKGSLEAVMPEWTPPVVGLHIVTPPGRNRPARVQLLIEHLVAQFQSATWAAE